jgi:DNA-binding Xre family transcriptional regulator
MPIKIDLDNMMWEKRIKTVTELSEKSKVSRATITNWKKNSVDRIELDVLEKLCSALDCEVHDLVIREK